MNSSEKTLNPSARWTPEFLEAARQQGDELADQLAAQLFPRENSEATGGRVQYNQLIDLADLLIQDAELLLIDNSRLATRLRQVPEPLRTYYSPAPCPDWVDSTKLEVAAQLWRDNSLAMLGVLYASSLPACYLIKNGIPALYRTDKLSDHKYIFQRIYETGLMLDSVMDPKGLEVVADPLTNQDELMLRALNEVDPGGKWVQQEAQFVRSVALAGPTTVTPETEEVQEAFARLQGELGPGRYLWGKGYIAARKVRMLHASMRFLLLNPDVVAPRKSGEGSASSTDRLAQNYQHRHWPLAQLGMPVNQEDLAYTLLTFSYLLPKGLEHWGCEVTLEQKEAFLHLWRVVGHVMGLRDDLMTDRWEEAEYLFEAIYRRQGGASEAGIVLTDSVTWFLKNYLPHSFGLREYLPVTLILDQLGWERGKLLFRQEVIDRATSIYGEFLLYGSRGFFITYYRFYQRITARIPFLERITSSLFHRSAEELIDSWRDEYDRQPFYVPKTLTVWERRRGVDTEFLERLRAWREEVFIGIFVPLLLFGLAGICGILTVVMAFLHHRNWTIAAGVGTVLLAFSGFWKMDVTLPRLFDDRPQLEAVKPRRGTLSR